MSMTPDQMVLAALCDRSRYRMLASTIPEGMLAEDLAWLLRWFKPYWLAYPDHESLDPDALYTLITLRKPLEEDRDVIVRHLIEQLRTPLSPEMVDAVVQQLTERDLAGKAAKLILDYQNGAEIDLACELQKMSTQAFEASSANSTNRFITGDDIDQVLDEMADDGGLRPTFLNHLDLFLRPMLPGDTVLFAAAPGSGKTSLLAHAVTSMCDQMHSLYGDRPVLWLNNEGSANRILGRVLSAALNKTHDEVLEMQKAGTLKKAYGKAVHGSGRIKIRDAHGYTMSTVERLVQATKPCVVVFDMMANFYTMGESLESHHKVERLWQTARELAVKYNFIALGTSQFSVKGLEYEYPTIEHLKDSKIGVQGAIETMLFMGKTPTPEGPQNIRYFSCPKVKRARPGVSYLKFEAKFDTDRCRFID